MPDMIFGFVIDEHGNLFTAQQVDQIMADVQKWAEDMAPVFENIRQAVEQAAAAFAEFGKALMAAFEATVGMSPSEWRQLMGEPDLEYVELAYRRYARWYNARHRGRKMSWRRLNADQRWEAQRRFAPG